MRSTRRNPATRYQAGDALARALHDNSAQITAHAIQEMAKAFRLTDPGRLVVVGPGGIFHVLGYGDRIMNTLRGAGYSAEIPFYEGIFAEHLP
jgi:hypothetical protein